MHFPSTTMSAVGDQCMDLEHGQYLFCAFSRRLSANKCSTKVYAIRPGFVGGTELGRETHWLLQTLATPIIWMFSKSLDQVRIHFLWTYITGLYKGCCLLAIGPQLYRELLVYDLKPRPFCNIFTLEITFHLNSDQGWAKLLGNPFFVQVREKFGSS